MTEEEPQSPCISVCVLDEADICQGCFRSAEEISDWFMVGSDEKREILLRARQRLEESTGFRLS